MSDLRALADGDLAAFHGLPAGLERAALDEALGEPGPEESGMLGGQPAVNRTYPPRDGAPFGIKAWLEGDAVAALEIREPPLRASGRRAARRARGEGAVRPRAEL